MFKKLSNLVIFMKKSHHHHRKADKILSNHLLISSLSSKSHNEEYKNHDQRIKLYVDELFKRKLLPSRNVQYKSMNELQQRVATILERFDYGMYKNNLNNEEFDQYESTREKFHLKSEEIFEILSTQNDDDDKLLKYFINNRCQLYEKFLRRLNRSQIRQRRKQDQHADDGDDNLRSGIWSDQNELAYGLWHNCLFTKMKRSSLSHLYDRRLTSQAMYCPSTPRVLIDLDYAMDQDFFHTRKILNDVRNLLAVNKYHHINPFRIEFVRSSHHGLKNSRFDKIVHTFMSWWNDPKQYQYTIHHVAKPVNVLESDEKLIYFTPNAKIPLTMSELLDERNIFAIPCHNSRSLRDPVFNRINRLQYQKSSSQRIMVRRLPTTEHIVWNKFHGVISWSLFLTILHDIRHNQHDDWNSVFKRYLLENELIKSDDELSREMQNRQQIQIKREKQIVNFNQSINVK